MNTTIETRRGRGLGPRLLGVVGVMVAVSLVGCASGVPRPARISHIVFFKLDDPSQRDELLADCDRLLPEIPGVVSYAAGRHLDVGRESVDGDYDLGLSIGFQTEAAYARYVVHPNHTELVGTWRERLTWLRAHDILDETD